MRELTYKVAAEFVQNYKAYTTPVIGGSISLSYADGYAGSWLLDKAREYGFPTIEKMNAACKKFIKTHKPEPVAKKQRVRIEVVKFLGKNGAFSAANSTMYRVELVGVNGKRESLDDWRNDGYGTIYSSEADKIAAKWATLLGCKVVLVDETKAKGKAA